MFRHPRTALIAVLASVAAALPALAPSPAGAVALTNACKNNVTADNTQLDVELTGSSPATVAPGAPFTLSNLSQTVFVPGAVFVTGYNLGLVHDGDVLPGNVRAVIEGANTAEGSQSTAQQPTSVGPVNINDPDGMPGTGDETADPAQASVAYPDQTWTAGAPGTIVFREDTIMPLAPNTGGTIINATIGGLISVQFRCSPGTVDPITGAITFIDPAPSFATAQVVGVPPNEFSFGKLKRNKRRGTAKLTVEVPVPGIVLLVKTKALKGASKTATVAGDVTLPVKARGKAAERLEERGKVRVRAKVTFTPTGGTPLTKSRQLKLVKRLRR